MLFNSGAFLVFALCFFPVYWSLRSHYQAQNAWLLAAGYVFYGYWSVKFLGLLVLSTLIVYGAGICLEGQGSSRAKKVALWISLSAQLGILGIFKYFNFFSANVTKLLSCAGFQTNSLTLNVVLPLGISFYTFRAMGYLLDVWNETIRPVRNPVHLALYMAFFPELPAGPIDRARPLISQFERPRRVEAEGVNAALWLLLWGFFKKLVIADRLAAIVDRVYGPMGQVAGMDIGIAVLAFCFQLYGDFSGYSDIARGLSKLMGLEIMVNFNHPFFALNPTDFWKRWHISLSSWFHDYLYMPLGLAAYRVGSWLAPVALWVTMVLIGFWHGASWTYVLFGAYQGVLVLGHNAMAKRMTKWTHPVWSRAFWKIPLMFGCTAVGLLIFRSASLRQAYELLSHLSFGTSRHTMEWGGILSVCVLPLLVVEIYEHRKGDLLVLSRLGPKPRLALYLGMLLGIMVFRVKESIEFVYFQF